MDSQDLAILAELHRDARATHEALGERVGLSGSAVQSRLARLQAEGVVQGFAAWPQASLLGLREGLLVFHGIDDAWDREEELLHGLLEVPGVRIVDLSTDHAVHLRVHARDEEDWERIERAAISLVGKPPSFRHVEPASGPAAPLTPADWRLVRALLTEGRIAIKDLASRAAVSFKTAKRRLASLLDEGRVHIEPVLSPSQASGLVLYTVVVLMASGARKEEVLPLMPDAILSGERGSRLVTLHASAPTARRAQAALAALKASPLVERAFLQVSTRRFSDGGLAETITHRFTPQPATPVAPPVPLPRSK